MSRPPTPSTTTQRIAEITRLAAELDKLDDALKTRISEREELLTKHNPGTRVSFGRYDDGEIRWGRHAKRWCFVWVCKDETVPLLNAPRHVRAAFSPLIDNVDSLLAAVIEALETEIKLRG